MINFSGPLFSNVDNRLISLKPLEYGLTNAVMFSPKEEVLQPSEVLYKKAILVERGSFRPIALVNGDMMGCLGDNQEATPARLQKAGRSSASPLMTG